MNKKRIVLVLMAVLGINSLSLATSNVKMQSQIVYAKETKLTDPIQINRLKGLKLKNLETSVVTNNGKAEVTFRNINAIEVKNVTATQFNHQWFKDREQVDKSTGATVGNVVAKWENGKLIVTGANRPGIYSTVVTIEYNNGNKESYTLSLVNKNLDKLEIGSSEVTPKAIVLKDIKFNGQSLKQSDKLSIREKGASNFIATVPYDTTKGAVFNKGINFEKGKVYEVVYQFGEGNQHEVVNQLILVKQKAPDVETFATNGTGIQNEEINQFTDKFKKVIQDDFVTGTVTFDSSQKMPLGTNNRYSDLVYNWKFDNESVFSTVQTVRENGGKNYPGGAIVNLNYDFDTQKNQEKINVSIKKAYVSKQEDVYSKSHFIPNAAVQVLYGGTNNYDNRDPKMVGEYKIKIGDDQANTYFDPTSDMTSLTGVSSAVSSQSGTYLGMKDPKQGVWLNQNTFNNSSNANIKKNYDYYDNFDHGYTNIPIVFKLENIDRINGESFSDIKTRLNLTKDIEVVERNVPGDTVKTSIIVRKDDTDAKIVGAQFVKTSESTGELTLSNGKDLVKNIGINNVADRLKVGGANIVLINTNDNNLKFQVTFDGQVPNSINWTFEVDDKNLIDSVSTLGGTLETSQGIYEAVNLDGGVKVTNQNTTNVESQFDLVTKFSSIVPSVATLGIDGSNSLRVTYKDLGNNNNKSLTAKVGTGKYQGTYSAGIWVEQQPFALEITRIDTSLSSATLTIDATFFDGKADLVNVTGGKIEYRKVGDSNWIDSRVEIKKEDIREEAITKTVTGLVSGGEYEFRVVYNYLENNMNKSVESNVVRATIDKSSTIISGNSGSTSNTTGTSVGSITINSTTSNTIKGGTDVVVTLPSGFKYDGKKNPVPVNFKYKGKDGKVVTEKKEDFSIVKASFDGDKLKLEGLVPGKDYTELHIDYTDNNNKTRTIILKNVKLESSVELEKYLANVYMVVFNRPADESGYHFHLGNLKGNKVSIREFLLNMLTEKEFIETYKTTESKIEALYSGIVGRESDAQGKDFWVSEYKKLLSVYGNEASTLKAIADRMVNEKELKELGDRMGVLY